MFARSFKAELSKLWPTAGSVPRNVFDQPSAEHGSPPYGSRFGENSFFLPKDPPPAKTIYPQNISPIALLTVTRLHYSYKMITLCHIVRDTAGSGRRKNRKREAAIA